MNQGQIIELILAALPEPRATDFDLANPRAVRFEWRGRKYKCGMDLYVQQVQLSRLLTSTSTILIRHCLLLQKKIQEKVKKQLDQECALTHNNSSHQEDK